jgi:hypothetical protein
VGGGGRCCSSSGLVALIAEYPLQAPASVFQIPGGRAWRDDWSPRPLFLGFLWQITCSAHALGGTHVDCGELARPCRRCPSAGPRRSSRSRQACRASRRQCAVLRRDRGWLIKGRKPAINSRRLASWCSAGARRSCSRASWSIGAAGVPDPGQCCSDSATSLGPVGDDAVLRGGLRVISREQPRWGIAARTPFHTAPTTTIARVRAGISRPSRLTTRSMYYRC